MLDDQTSDPASFKKDLLGTPFEEKRPPKKDSEGQSRLPFILAILSLGLGVILLIFLLQLNSKLNSREQELNEQIASLTDLIETVEADLEDGIEATSREINTVSDDVAQVQKTVGLTRSEIQNNRNLAQQIRQKQEQDVQNLAQQLEVKADTEKVSTLEQKSDTKFEEIDERIEGVQVDVKESRAELEKTYQEMLDLGLKVSEQGQMIATNLEGVEELRRRGERDYLTFELEKKVKTRVAGITLELRDTDPNPRDADIRIFVNDNEIDRRDVAPNTPINFYVGTERVSYELVFIEISNKPDRAKGYVSVPKGTLPAGVELQRSSN
jgi:hypothetical protein